ncbi:acetolactate synthase large subunit [Chloroflexota bacterium]
MFNHSQENGNKILSWAKNLNSSLVLVNNQSIDYNAVCRTVDKQKCELKMNGAEFLTKTAIRAGIEVCFANAGTTEMPIVLALDSEPGIKAILGLFEGVCTGAADGYGRMLDKPALALLHLGPGFANGIANLHNAQKAKTPLLNLIGEHATWHRAADPPSAMNIEPLASTVSGWYKTNESPTMLSQDLAEAVAVSMYGQISSLIIPSDHQWAECTNIEIATPEFSFDPIDSDSIDKAVQLLKAHNKTGLIMGGRALRQRGLQAAARIKAATGCDLLTNSSPAYVDRGTGLPDVTRIPYFPDSAIKLMSQYEALVLAGTKEPVTFFGYNGFDSYVLKEKQKRLQIATDRQNAAEALECLADALNARFSSNIPDNILARSSRPSIPQGGLTPEKVCLALAALLPENAIIVDEGLTTSFAYYPLTAGLPPHAFLKIAGGAIGYGMPCAVGASVACPERPVINFQADGSALYTIQALWTEARESLNIITLICANRSYNILKMELSRAGITSIGPKVLSLIDLDHPAINWVKLAEGMGVPAVSVNSIDGLAKEFHRALSESGPHLIEMMIV